MTDVLNIEALVAKLKATPGIRYNFYVRQAIDVLERHQAVVMAARGYMVHGSDKKGTHGTILRKALAALDAPPEGDEVKPHLYSPDYQAMGDCRTCGRLERDPIHAPPEGDE